MATASTIHERMVAILADLPAIGKGQYNEQQKFHFRGHDDVLNALNPLLAKHGVFVVPQVLDRVVAQRTTSKGSVMFEVNLRVEYVFYGLAGDHVSASAWGEGTDMGDKATNKAMTMAFKNVLNQAFAISTAETIDSDAHTPDETAKPAAKPAQEKPQFAAPDGLGLQSSRADADVPDDGQPGNVQVFFGKNAGSRLVDLTPKQRQWYAESWVPSDPVKFPVGPKERRLRQAARQLCGIQPVVEPDGWFAHTAAPDSDDDIPF